jgi:acyl-CoA synthetase (NDP forming)
VQEVQHLYRYAVMKQEWYKPEKVKINDERRTKVKTVLRENSQTLCERTTKEILELYGLLITKEYLAESADKAVQIAEKMGYPVVMKIDKNKCPKALELLSALKEIQS